LVKDDTLLEVERLRELILSLQNTLPQGFIDEMGGNAMKRVRVFIGEEIKVDKNQQIWLSAKVC